MTHVDGHEAYRDDPEYTAPEMQPHATEGVGSDTESEIALASGMSVGMGVGGGALAGEVLIEDVEADRAEKRPKPDGR